jgi:hypothetical protein
MSDNRKEGNDMGDIDAEFRKIVRIEDRIANHATFPREELETHIHERHGVVAATDVFRGRIALETIDESELQAQHRRMHELGVEHRG